MNRTGQTIRDDAIGWIIRQREPAFDDWVAFGDWLAADPEHAETYHAMADADRDVPLLMPAAPRPVIRPRPGITRRAWLGGALAASLVAVASYTVLQNRASPYVLDAAAGVPRSVVLADGSRIEMNGGTRLVLDRNDRRAVTLAHGEAVFTVTHDAADPFRLVVGDATLVDAGTVFNVVRTGSRTDVAVAEGVVIYNPGHENFRLSAGRSMRVVDRDTRLLIGEVAPGVIGAWRTGTLTYTGTPLALVAEDLTRNLGVEIVAAPAVAGRTFRGVISFGRDRSATIGRLGPLLGVHVRRDGKRWLLVDKDT
ncbi:FecR family protein [Glacieibacterium sp.]|uniref:FecR family protein n=1 Tax=Glacieibacterium sp. TaxID=2860237 RepID=UPI003B00FFB0